MRIAAFILVILLTGCLKSKRHYYDTLKLNDYYNCKSKLYVETYRVGGLKSDYLTDSVNFRKYIGSYDDEQGMISFRCKEDSIFVYTEDRIDNKLKMTDTIMYLVKALKADHKFE